MIHTAGTGLTAGQSFGAMYDASGNLLGVTTDRSAAFASTGEKVMPLVTPYVATGPMLVRVGVWSVGSGPPQIARAGTTLAGTANFGMTSPLARSGSADSGLTTTAPNPLGTATQSSSILLFGVS